tara:strand:- start:283 stop:1713 length:1431 start_codon:yes stop_codon:yes gene_type:complete
MSKFKLKAPYGIDPVARYEVPFTPDNVGDDNGLVAKANDNGTMIVNKNIPLNSKLRKEAESHEDHHLKDMIDGKLAYDDNAVYHNLDGKGVKRVDRKNFSESDKSLPWEKNAYKAGDNLEEKDMRPNPNKLNGPPNMKDDTPLAFQKIGSRHKFGRQGDKSKVSMNENFGPSMIKKFTPLALGKGEPDASGSPYAGDTVYFSPEEGKLVHRRDADGQGTFNIKRDDKGRINWQGYTKGASGSIDSIQNASSFKNKPSGMSDEQYNAKFRNQLNKVEKEYQDKMRSYNYYDDVFTKGGDLPTIKYGGGNITLKPGQDFKSLVKEYGSTAGAMDHMEFVYDKPSTTGKGSIGSGTVTLAGLLEDQKAAAAKAGMKGSSGAYSDLRKAITGENTKQKKRNYELTSKELAKAQEAFPDIFTGTNTQTLKRKAATDKLSKEYFGQGGVGGILNDVGGAQRYRLEKEYQNKLAELQKQKFDI